GGLAHGVGGAVHARALLAVQFERLGLDHLEHDVEEFANAGRLAERIEGDGVGGVLAVAGCVFVDGAGRGVGVNDLVHDAFPSASVNALSICSSIERTFASSPRT